MPKIKVNTASRDELIAAGMKADLAEAILRLRRKGRIESIEALDIMPGVGPVTFEQLREILDFNTTISNDGVDYQRAGQKGGLRQST